MLSASVRVLPQRRCRLSAWRRAAACALVLLAGAATAQPPARWSQHTELSFQHLTQAQGLPNEIATAVAQDGAGFLWVGTLGGLARWDGYRMRVHTAAPGAEGALPDNVVQVLHRDAAGRLWVGTSAAGLARHDPATDRFVHHAAGPQGLSHVSVRSVADDGRGGLWVGTDGGLDHLDPASGRVQRAAGEAGLPRAGVNALLRDGRGALWAGTAAGLFRRDAGAAAFVPVALAAGGAGEPSTLAEDARGRIWVGTLRHGAFVVDASGAHAAAPAVLGDQQQQVTSLVEARPGEMWVGTANHGIVAIDDAGVVRRIANRSSLPVSLADNAVRGLFRDRAGLVWVATNRGVSQHDPRQSALLTWYGPSVRDPADPDGRRISTEVSWVLPMPDGRIWLGTHKRGVDIVDGSGALVGALRPDASRPAQALPPDVVLALERAGDGNVFIGTKRGLYRASADGRRVERVTMAGRDPAAPTWALFADGATLWVGGMYDGLWRLDTGSGAAARFRPAAGQRLSDERVILVARADADTLWVGTRNGLNRVEPAQGRVRSFTPEAGVPQSLPAGFVTTLYTDRRGRLWVGTYGGGIAIHEPGTPDGRFRRLGAAHGLPDDNVNAIVEGPQGAVWASTDSGLARIDPADLSVRPLRRAEGVVLPTYWTGAAARTPQGELLFGGAGGMTVVLPAELRAWDYRPPVVVSELLVGGVRATAAPVVVTPGANSLAVEFAAVDFSAPERNRYAYRLEGFDADWIATDPSRRLAAYTNLPPGDYRLLLRGSNRDGAWSERVVALPVRVLPAWHQTWWARIAAVVLALAAVFAVVQRRTRALRERQAELERKVRERTAELEAVSRALEEKSRVLERSAITDPLTGLHNRRFLTEQIDGQVAASLRRATAPTAPGERAPVDTDHVFFLVDVDRFKQVNDRHGHGVGDAVLVQFGRRLAAALRESDHLVRWGGEEFLAVARETDRARAEELAERMRGAIADTPFVLDDGQPLHITCSIGFACLPFAGAPDGAGWQDIVRLADTALFAAKRSGRDAWVGLHAGPAWPAAGTPLPLQQQAAVAVRRGLLRATSNRALAHVEAALDVDTPAGAPPSRESVAAPPLATPQPRPGAD